MEKQRETMPQLTFSLIMLLMLFSTGIAVAQQPDTLRYTGAEGIEQHIENLAERSAALRLIAQRAGPTAADRVQAAVAAIEPQLESKTGIERARSWAQLALLKTDQGALAQSDKYSQLAQTTAGLSAADAVTVSAELIVQRDLASAKTLHTAGRYAEAELVLQRLAGYLR